ncbi:selenoprotein [Bacterioplanes sanyensis]|uniref:Selenoprotein n=1 Tax=Bacterioplanes sanyensis TaxID=1249553 RepID=A0A222FMZ7_9GAMM|nr:Rdx family protein [Bacterioplanes sanyensis]ASP40407.1 selenoprotein [Bacterioplanes sanyensis]
MKHTVTIVFCEGCRWALRSGWYAQELLSTFQGQLGGVLLQPGEQGQFQVWVGEQLIWCRKRDGGFPDAADLKRRVRDIAAEGQSLGHCDLPQADEGASAS